MTAARPADVSLDSSLAFKLGYCPDSIEAELQRMFAITPREQF